MILEHELGPEGICKHCSLDSMSGGGRGPCPKRSAKVVKAWDTCTWVERKWLVDELNSMFFNYTDRKPTPDWAERAAVIKAAVAALSGDTQKDG